MTDDAHRRAGAFARQAMNALAGSINPEATLAHLFRRAMDEARQEPREVDPAAPPPVGSLPVGRVLSPREIGALAGLTKDTAYQRMRRAVAAGYLAHEAPGVYRVTTKGSSHIAFAMLTRGRYTRAASVSDVR